MSGIQILNVSAHGLEQLGEETLESELKIVFSRKGFDGTAGGCPSPIRNAAVRQFAVSVSCVVK